MSEQRIGFVGLGRMGAPIAGRLAAARHPVVGFDAAGTAERLPEGVEAADSVGALAAATDVLFMSVPDGAASLEVCRQVVEEPSRKASVVVNLSTVGVSAAHGCAWMLTEVGVQYLDAPVSGGVAGARSGSLAVMVGGSPAEFERLLPLLEIVGRNCFLIGSEVGHGQAMKLLNNYISAAALAATCEATVFGARLGLDLARMIEVINVSTGRTTASTDKFPRSIIPGTYDFGFAGALMTKDALLYRDEAERADVPREVADAVAAVWDRFNQAYPRADFTYLHHYLAEQASE